MDISKLRTPAAVQSRDVRFADGTVAPLHFKRVGSLAWLQLQTSLGSRDPIQQAEGILRLVVASCCEPDGSPAFDYETAKTIDGDVIDSMYNAAFDVNRRQGEDKGKS